jgi:hypothetical protein
MTAALRNSATAEDVMRIIVTEEEKDLFYS